MEAGSHGRWVTAEQHGADIQQIMSADGGLIMTYDR